MSDLRSLPSVDRLLADCGPLIQSYGRMAVTQAVRSQLVAIRATRPDPVPDAQEILIAVIKAMAAQARSRLRPVLNLTGTVLHTNLGRALLAESAIEAAVAAMRAPAALEFDLDDGGRGERDSHLRGLLCELTGAEDATVVNNNASAVLITLNTLAKGREAIVSRGELIEIGGAFRMPAIMEQAGCILREVGTTNRTHAKDYREAIGPETGLLMKVHTSNYRIEGFTKEVLASELAAIAHAAGLPMVNDLGSGTLVDLRRWGLSPEPTVAEAVAEGADVVTFSGDKLLGGPQAGFIVGKREIIAAINRNPLKRAVRMDKIRIAATEATLRLYRNPDCLAERLPTLRLLARTEAEIRAQAERLAPRVEAKLGCRVRVTPCASQIGSGALPTETIPSAGLALTPSPEALADRLRGLDTPIIGHIHDGELILDLRCLPSDQALLDALSA
ncbi:L-seryl-tRNA(Sec) selenium transferase [Paracoccus aestuariivivens]|uniref:L-seryl-tRNA(Sec) selenium transferase n=1 Tax=Paracoccus aestuariivivens TaxID=1820333 RepID=A0A6L6JCB6_9RHOB|nr:L-seryl-tRNA(Sec) selenium transferase [Paracoccus aestuariivivens]MTH78277.1 L-seryl-tRNA(Sec) selenium transferase [Paracoccus aestuariivivens]